MLPLRAVPLRRPVGTESQGDPSRMVSRPRRATNGPTGARGPRTSAEDIRKSRLRRRRRVPRPHNGRQGLSNIRRWRSWVALKDLLAKHRDEMKPEAISEIEL